jgi:ABC-type phosphate/phosphonate transport system substrate-binding protein
MYEPGGAANAALWDGLRAYLAADGVDDLPDDLTVPADYETTWLDPYLLLSQTCGYPLRHRLERRVRYVGTPVYEVEGTDGPYYRSAIVVRADDPAEALVELRGRRAAYNGLSSQSGYNAFRDLVAPLARDGRFFANVIETGSHAASVRAVIADKADIAAIDQGDRLVRGDSGPALHHRSSEQWRGCQYASSEHLIRFRRRCHS